MSFLRRLMGGGSASGAGGAADAPGSPAGEDEAERERRLLREEGERLDDDLIQRQLRYADRSWVPAAQGGERRADDRENGEG